MQSLSNFAAALALLSCSCVAAKTPIDGHKSYIDFEVVGKILETKSIVAPGISGLPVRKNIYTLKVQKIPFSRHEKFYKKLHSTISFQTFHEYDFNESDKKDDKIIESCVDKESESGLFFLRSYKNKSIDLAVVLTSCLPYDKNSSIGFVNFELR